MLIPRRLRLFLFVCLLLACAGPVHSQQSSQPSPWRRPDGSKALLQSLGVKFDEIKDREEHSDKQLELYLRVLTRLRQLPPGLVHEWSKAPPALDSLLKAPETHRGELFHLEGIISWLKKFEIPDELADRFDVKTIYRLSIDLSKDTSGIGRAVGKPEWIEVWTTQIPSGLKFLNYTGPPGSVKDDTETVSAAYLKFNAAFLAIKKEPDRKRVGDGFERPIFVASRIAWLPKALHEGEHLTPSNLVLSKANFDISLLDPVRAESSKRLTPEVTEPFLQMLAAQPRVDWKSLQPKALELGNLIANPESFIGEAIELDAIARRVVEIPIEKEDDCKRLGIDRYFEIDLVLPKSVRTLVKDKDGTEQEVIQENFPLTICTTSPPKGLAIGEDIRQQIHAKAFFFKLWAYESKFASEHAGDAMQVSPLFISANIEITAPPDMSFASAFWVVGGALALLACLTVWGYLVLRTDDLRQLALKKQTNSSPDLPGPPPASAPLPPLDASP